MAEEKKQEVKWTQEDLKRKRLELREIELKIASSTISIDKKKVDIDYLKKNINYPIQVEEFNLANLQNQMNHFLRNKKVIEKQITSITRNGIKDEE